MSKLTIDDDGDNQEVTGVMAKGRTESGQMISTIARDEMLPAIA
jgi:hypothetical protein